MFEKEAAEWVTDNVCKDCSRYENCKSKEHCVCKECSKEKWQKGAEFGYNKANKWHDLCKDPDDLPKIDERFDTKVSVPVFSSKGNFVVYYFETKEWYCNGQKEEVIAWLEWPPKFKGNEI